MQQSIHLNQTLKPKSGSLLHTIFFNYIKYTQRQEEHKMLWYILGLVFIPCAAIILSVFAMHFMHFSHMAYYMTSTFILYYAIVVAHMGGGKAVVYVSLFFLNILYLIGAPLLVLFFV